ncbi:acyltransferase family protein [Nitratireductor sp.]|uniref:acyltransferase family protein n=1 Tax=Nitratireductor sp. TaxID=1872084 RepID=UPI00262F92FC|nr:acyltransferase family protein [Nitratireductor sp.]MCV0378959.1 acyltransferase [Nitratireductor sp.]
MSSGYFVPEATSRALLHTWSLGVEEQFYLVWPATLLVCWKIGRGKLLVAVSLITVTSFAWSVWHLQIDETGAFFLLPARVFEFGIGATIAIVGKDWRFGAGASNVLTATGLVLIAVPVVFYSSDYPFPSYGALAPCLGAAFCITSRGNGILSSIALSNQISNFIGRISYSLYLVHWPVIVISQYVLMREFDSAERWIALIASLVLAYVSYRYVETPFRRRVGTGYGAFISDRWLAVSVATTVAAGIGASIYVYQSNGWPSRIGPDRQILLDFTQGNDLHRVYYGGRGCDNRRCETNPSAEVGKTIFVIGDSHARALYAGLLELEHYNFIIFGPDACPMFSMSDRREKNRFADACVKVQEAAFKEISKYENPTVIISQHWAARSRASHASNPSFPFSNTSDFARHASKELDQLADELGIGRLIVMGGIPRYSAPLSPIDCATRPYRVEHCVFAAREDDYLQEHDLFNAAITASDGRFLNPYAVFCDEFQCQNFTDDGMPIYSDRTHLSVWGSRELVKAIERHF